MALAFGIDLGGTKVEISVLDDIGRQLLRRRVPHPRDSYENSIETVANLIAGAEADVGRAGSIGLCHPGAISPVTGLLKNCNSTWLNGMPFDSDLIDRVGRPIALTNDANAMVLSEATDGAGAGEDIVFGVIVGTGCGGGVSVGGRVLEGANAIAGEWGHMPLPWPEDDERPGRSCYCGRKGCLETWLAGPGFEADHRTSSGHVLTAAGIVEAAERGDAAAETSLRRYEHRLARSLANIVNILDPQVIVLAGGVSNVRRLYDNVPKILPEFVFSDTVANRLVQAVHGDSSGVRGAAWLGRDLANG